MELSEIVDTKKRTFTVIYSLMLPLKPLAEYSDCRQTFMAGFIQVIVSTEVGAIFQIKSILSQVLLEGQSQKKPISSALYKPYNVTD